MNIVYGIKIINIGGFWNNVKYDELSEMFRCFEEFKAALYIQSVSNNKLVRNFPSSFFYSFSNFQDYLENDIDKNEGTFINPSQLKVSNISIQLTILEEEEIKIY